MARVSSAQEDDGDVMAHMTCYRSWPPCDDDGLPQVGTPPCSRPDFFPTFPATLVVKRLHLVDT
jgi:hypothetical protein